MGWDGFGGFKGGWMGVGEDAGMEVMCVRRGCVVGPGATGRDEQPCVLENGTCGKRVAETESGEKHGRRCFPGALLLGL